MLLLLALAGCPKPAPPPTAGAALSVARPADPRVGLVLEAGAAALEPAVRRRALAALVATSSEPAGGAWARRGQYDPNPYVQRAVIAALATRDGDAAAIDLLAAWVAPDAWTRAEAALALARVAPPRVPGGDEPGLRLARAVARDEAAALELASAIAAGRAPAERWFWSAVGTSGLVALIPAIQAALATTDEEAAPQLAAALRRLDAQAGRAALGPVWTGEEAGAIEALGLLRGAGPEPLREAAAAAPGVARQLAELALMGLGERPLSADALADPDPEVRAEAARAIGARLAREPDASGAAKARLALVGALSDRDEAVSLAAVDGVALAAPDLLTGLLDHPSLLLRVAAAEHLAP